MTENTFHYENLRRRSRYAAVFVIMLSAFLAILLIIILFPSDEFSARLYPPSNALYLSYALSHSPVSSAP